MKATMHGGFLLLFTVLQATLLDYARIFGVKPNLLLVYILVLAFFCGSKAESAAVGFAFGLALDVCIGRLLGANAVCGLIFGFFVAFFCERTLGSVNIFIVLISVILLSALYEFVYYLFSFGMMNKLNIAYALKRVILIEGLYNGAAALPLFYILKSITKYLYADKGEGIG